MSQDLRVRRAGLSRGEIDAIRGAFKRLFRSGDSIGMALDGLEAETDPDPEGAAQIAELIAFCRESKRGICRWEPKKK